MVKATRLPSGAQTTLRTRAFQGRIIRRISPRPIGWTMSAEKVDPATAPFEGAVRSIRSSLDLSGLTSTAGTMAELERTPEPASSWRGWAARGTASSIPGSNSAPRRVNLEPIPTSEVQRSAVGQQKVTDPGITGKKRTPGECRGPQDLQAISL